MDFALSIGIDVGCDTTPVKIRLPVKSATVKFMDVEVLMNKFLPLIEISIGSTSAGTTDVCLRIISKSSFFIYELTRWLN